jgi:hypothetical protein
MIVKGLFGSPALEPLLRRQRLRLGGISAYAMSVHRHPNITRSAPLLYVYDTLITQSVYQFLRLSLSAIDLGGYLWRCASDTLKQIDDAWQTYRLHLMLGFACE